MSRHELPQTPSAWHRRVWTLSWPVMLSNATVPLVGAVDTAVVGQLPDPAYIGAVAFGALVFNFFAWIFGFLRMGTTGFTAQAWGAGDLHEVSATACRAALLALLIALGIWWFQTPIRHFAFWCLGGSAEVETLASVYYDVRVWSVPAAMLNQVVLGLLFGIQRMRLALVLQLVLNGLNIGLDLLFVQGFGWGVPGVALATVVAEASAAALGLGLAWRSLRRLGCPWPHHGLLDRRRLKALFEVNANLTIRTLCVQAISFYMISAGAKIGDVTLAANAILLHFNLIMSFGLDGFAHAAEALTGRAYGSRNARALRAVVLSALSWAAVAALAFCLFYFVAGRLLINWMTVLPAVRLQAYTFLPWLVVAPLVAVWAYLLDGVYLGTTHTAEMRNGMLLALSGYLVCVWVTQPLLHNHGLWLSFILFLLGRTLPLAFWYRRIERAADGVSSTPSPS